MPAAQSLPWRPSRGRPVGREPTPAKPAARVAPWRAHRGRLVAHRARPDGAVRCLPADVGGGVPLARLSRASRWRPAGRGVQEADACPRSTTLASRRTARLAPRAAAPRRGCFGHHHRLVPGLISDPSEDAMQSFPAMPERPIPWVEPEDVSHAVIYLASEESRSVTGLPQGQRGALAKRGLWCKSAQLEQ